MSETAAPAPQDLGAARRSPRQARARATVDAVLEAATRILEAGQPFTTNHVAERAGVSVGTLYQYFPNKAAILEALGARERAAMQAASLAGRQEADPVRASIRAQLSAFDGRTNARRAVLQAILQAPATPGMAREIDAGIAPFVGGGERAVHAFVISRAVMGVVRAAVLEASPLLGTQALEDALVRLVQGYRAASPNRSK
ncbi:MAG: TetR/AcrR family transcriptional regulator [Pseudomonadota bacterium]